MKSVSLRTQLSLQSLLSKDDSKQNYTDHNRVQRMIEAKGAISPPSEELLSYLNHIGQRYPFCVNFKYKLYDPL